MMTITLKRAFAATMMAAVPLLTLRAPAMSATASCDLGTVIGVYTYSYAGFTISPTHNHIPFVVAGLGSYDGHGHIKGASTTTTNDGHESRAKPLAYTGVYTVSADCHVVEVDTDVTGAVTHYDEYTGPAGSAITFVETDYNVVATGIQTRD